MGNVNKVDKTNDNLENSPPTGANSNYQLKFAEMLVSFGWKAVTVIGINHKQVIDKFNKIQNDTFYSITYILSHDVSTAKKMEMLKTLNINLGQKDNKIQEQRSNIDEIY